MKKTKVQGHLLSDYDYVIIGAGSCDGVLAKRLSEDAGKFILVLETGADDQENPDIAVPGNLGKLQSTSFNWGYRSVSQKGSFKGYEEQCNIGDGVRQSSAESYLRPASGRDNLHIAYTVTSPSIKAYGNMIWIRLLVLYAIRINFKIARAVEFVRNGQKQLVPARRETLLCAGVIGSPQILMLSGIGPWAHMQDLGIPVQADLPVGDNLQDHCGTFGMEFEINEPYSVRETQENDNLYNTLKAGCLGTTVAEAIGLVRSDVQDPENPNPDLMLFFGTFCLGHSENSTGRLRYQIMEHSHVRWERGKKSFLIIPNVTHPKSRGTIRLASTDPFAPPLIDPNTFSHPDDIKVLVEGLKMVLKFGQNKALRTIGCKFRSRVLPGYKGTPYTDEYWEELARTLTLNTYHPAGTCRMGRVRDVTTVVDPQLRVKGIDRLRVVDAFIMPEITSANLNATCFMIAEKAADMIKGKDHVAHL